VHPNSDKVCGGWLEIVTGFGGRICEACGFHYGVDGEQFMLIDVEMGKHAGAVKNSDLAGVRYAYLINSAGALPLAGRGERFVGTLDACLEALNIIRENPFLCDVTIRLALSLRHALRWLAYGPSATAKLDGMGGYWLWDGQPAKVKPEKPFTAK
jgi:hypothetical protein